MSPVVEPTLDVERALLAEGFPTVIGLDEVGRGAIAGPVTVGAAVLAVPVTDAPAGLRDSKLLSEPRRVALIEPVAAWTAGWTTGEASPSEIDGQGIVPSLGLAAIRALRALAVAGRFPEGAVVLLDGTHDWLTPQLRRVAADDALALAAPHGIPVRVRAKADRDCAIVSAASVLAKVARDAQLVQAAIAHPAYGWDGNKGYGSPGHLAAIAELGPTPLHRISWLRTPAAATAPEAGLPLGWSDDG